MGVESANWDVFNSSSYFSGSMTSTSASPTTGIAAPRTSAEPSSMKLDIGLIKGSRCCSGSSMKFFTLDSSTGNSVVVEVEISFILVSLRCWLCFSLLCEKGGNLVDTLGVMPSLEASVSKISDISCILLALLILVLMSCSVKFSVFSTSSETQACSVLLNTLRMLTP